MAGKLLGFTLRLKCRCTRCGALQHTSYGGQYSLLTSQCTACGEVYAVAEARTLYQAERDPGRSGT